MRPDPTEAHEPDPLYDAHYLIFIYALWVLSTSAFGPTIGLIALVGATATLTVSALINDRGPEPRSFAAEFGSILLFSAAGIALAVLCADALREAPELIIGLGLLLAAAAIVLRLAWTELRIGQSSLSLVETRAGDDEVVEALGVEQEVEAS